MDKVIDLLDGDVLGVDVEWPANVKPRCAVADRIEECLRRHQSRLCDVPAAAHDATAEGHLCGSWHPRGLSAHPARRRVCLWPISRLRLSRINATRAWRRSAEFAPSGRCRTNDTCGGATGLGPAPADRVPPPTPSTLKSRSAWRWEAPRSGSAAPVAPAAKPPPKPHQQHKTTRAPSTSKRAAAATRPAPEHAKSHHYDNIPLVSKGGRLLGLVPRARTGTATGAGGGDDQGRVVPTTT